MIELVSAVNLCKTGISADRAGDFRQLPPQIMKLEFGDKGPCVKARVSGR
jgi:hypothetical protein